MISTSYLSKGHCIDWSNFGTETKTMSQESDKWWWWWWYVSKSRYVAQISLQDGQYSNKHRQFCIN